MSDHAKPRAPLFGKQSLLKAAGALVACLFFLGLPLKPALADVWQTGNFTFSDELGGFEIISVSGSGTPSDPIIIVEELHGLDPVILIIGNDKGRAEGEAFQAQSTFLSIAMVKIVFNRSERSWGGFDLELQQIVGTPSTYGDGLSFDQTGAFRSPVESDRFFLFRQVEEPLDRIHFYDGAVDTGDKVRFSFFITDPTPTAKFFLVQEPFFLMTEGPTKSPQLATGTTEQP